MTNPWPLTPDPDYYLASNWLQAGYNRNGVFYVGDTVVIPRTPTYLRTDPHTADFELGSNGVAPTSSDPGSYSPLSIFGTGITYSNTHARGSLSLAVASGATGKVSWGGIIPTDGKTHHGRLDVYATANPTSTTTILEIDRFNQSTHVQVCLISVNTTGHITYSGNVSGSFATTIPLNQFFRIEWGVVHDSPAGSIELRLYAGADDSSPQEVKLHTGLTLFDVSVDGVSAIYGSIAGDWGTTYWLDDLVANSDTWVGNGSPNFPTLTHSYEVRNFDGEIVSFGTFDEYVCSPTAPAGGWDPGWYRIYFTGTETDTLYGPSYGVTQFAVLRDDPHFLPMPSGDTNGGHDVASDFVMKGVLGLGSSRISLDDLAALSDITNALEDAALAKSYWTDPGASYLDPNRPRHLWANVPGQGVDRIRVLNGTPAQSFGYFYCKDETVDGSQVFVAVDNGTSSGNRIRVYSPNNTTLIETYDNVSSFPTAINGVSSYVKFFADNGGTATNFTVTAVGSTYYNNLASAVSDLYAAGVGYFEGPTNEPAITNAGNAPRWVHEMRLFQAAVHAGNASAKAIGPCTVDIYTTKLDFFFAAGGGAYCDELSFHAYNYVDADIHVGKTNLQNLDDMLTTYGQETKPRWQTESTQGSSSIFVHVPHKNCRWYMWNVLLMEQYGFPRERNNPWYEKAHGFWSFPAFLRTSDGALTPQAVLGRVLAEETWGKPFASALDFGTPGNDLFIGNLYVNPSDTTSVVVVVPTSAMSNGGVTFHVTGTTGPLTAVDTFGNESSITVSGGLATLPVTELNAFLRLPGGASVTVASCNNWASTELTEVPVSSASVGGVSTSKPIDDTWQIKYDGSSGNAFISANAPPEDVTLTFSVAQTIDRVVVWSGFVWQNHCGLVKFDVQTTTDGSNWTTRATVDNSAACETFLFGAGTNNTGTSYESFYKEPWVFDVPFSPVNATAVRLYVYQTTYGGMPDTQAKGPNSDNGVWQPQHVTIQEMKVYSDSPIIGVGTPEVVVRRYPSLFVDEGYNRVPRRDLYFSKG